MSDLVRIAACIAAAWVCSTSFAVEEKKEPPVLVLRVNAKGEVIVPDRKSPLSNERDLKSWLAEAWKKSDRKKDIVLAIQPDADCKVDHVRLAAVPCARGPFPRVQLRIADDLVSETQPAAPDKAQAADPSPDIEQSNGFLLNLKAGKDGRIVDVLLVGAAERRIAVDMKNWPASLETALRKIAKEPKFRFHAASDRELLWSELGKAMSIAKKAGIKEQSLTLGPRTSAGEPDLTNTDIGLDPSLPLNYDVERIEDVGVPGVVDPTGIVGLEGGPKVLRLNLGFEKDGRTASMILEGKKLDPEKWRDELLERLKAIRKTTPEATSLLLTAHKDTPHGNVVAVQDICRKAGLDRITFGLDAPSKVEKTEGTIVLSIDGRGKITASGKDAAFKDVKEMQAFLKQELEKAARAGSKVKPTVLLECHKSAAADSVRDIVKSCTEAGVRSVKVRTPDR